MGTLATPNVGCTRWESAGAGGTDSLSSRLTSDVPLATRPFQPRVIPFSSLGNQLHLYGRLNCSIAGSESQYSALSKGILVGSEEEREKEREKGVCRLLGYTSCLFDSCSI